MSEQLPDEAFDDDVGEDIPALQTMRRALAATPVLKRGLGWSLAMAVLFTVGQVAVPILVQRVIDSGLGEGEVDLGFVLTICGLTALFIVAVGIPGLIARIRMGKNAEETLYQLRVQAFDHVHDLSLADHNEFRKGALVARVTSDVDGIARFIDWGLLSWLADTSLIVGILLAMAWYSWQLTIVVILMMGVFGPVLRMLQKRQVRAYDLVRTRVGEFLGLAGEMVGGAETVRAYGYGPALGERLDQAIRLEYKARMGSAKYFSTIFAIGDLFGAVTLVIVTITMYYRGTEWGLGAGEMVAFLLFLGQIQQPISRLTEVLDQTQIALAGWNKVLGFLDTKPTVAEPVDGVKLPDGPLSIEACGTSFQYLEGVPVLSDVNVSIPAGVDVAIVGETGSGKTTFARLLVRLMDPTSGSVKLGDVSIETVSPEARRGAVRMVPQDGFLFDTTIRENIRYGGHEVSDTQIGSVLEDLGLTEWVAGFADGLDTEVGERGERLSVGERQLVALARAAVADPGLLVLDEATSSVDPETEQVLSNALARLSEGRTTVAIAHRLSTAERADLVLVFDAGQLVEVGSHDELVAAGGRYSELHASWERTTSSLAN